MVLRIPISPATEAKLREQAEAMGQPVEALAARIVEEAVARSNGGPASTRAALPQDVADPRLAALREWAQLQGPESELLTFTVGSSAVLGDISGDGNVGLTEPTVLST